MFDSNVSQPTPAELDATARVLFQYLREQDRPRPAQRLKTLLQRGELPADCLFVVRHEGVVSGAMMVLAAAGAAGLVWPPQVVPSSDRGPMEDALIAASIRSLADKGVKVATALLRETESEMGMPLLRHGFCRITTLEYLRRRAHLPPPPIPSDPRLSFETYDQASREILSRTLVRTYEGTRDCPELDGVRTADEILAGHQAQGQFDPSRWWLARLEGEPVGVLLVNALRDEDAWEVVYMGVVPAARGCGLGCQLMAKSLREAHAARIGSVTLSVDCRNFFARQLYAEMGFKPYDRQEVYLAILGRRHAADRS